MVLVPFPIVDFYAGRKMRFDQPSQVNRSAWTGKTKIVRLPGAARWTLSLGLPPINNENDVKPWRAFFVALEGVGNVFDVKVACQPSGATVGAAAAGAQTAAIGGGLVAGDFVTFNLASGAKQLCVLTTNAGDFRPPLREAASSGVGFNPYCRMRLANSVVGWDENDGIYSVAFDAEEAT
jgi:hypothetical protein